MRITNPPAGHDDLSGVSTSDHHTKYSDSDARGAVVEDAVYGSGWNADTTHAPSQNAVYDQLESVKVSDTAYAGTWNAVTTIPPSKNAVYDKFEALVAPYLVLIGTVVASGDNDLTITGIDSTYDTYVIALSDIVPGSDNSGAWLRLGDASGVDSGASDYAYHSTLALSSSTDYASSASESAAQMVISGLAAGNASGEGIGALLFLSCPSDGTNQAVVHGTYGVINYGNVFGGGQMNGNRRAVIAVDRVQFLFHSGTVATGRMAVWGMRHA